MFRPSFLSFLAMLLLGQWIECHGWITSYSSSSSSSSLVKSRDLLTRTLQKKKSTWILYADSETNTKELPIDESGSVKKSLEEKMKSWEATEEEVRAATLGGVVPGRTDAFDIGLYIAFPLMVLSGLAFALFPFIMGSLDVDGVGPPPTL